MTTEQPISTQLEREVSWLVDRAQIEDLIYAYGRTSDLKDWKGFAELFTEDGVFVLPWSGRFAGATGRESLETFSREGLGRFA